MADVQLEHGHVRVANRLLEAILDADFSGAQMRILLALFRLTFGWRKRTVTITVAELARLTRLSPTGGFRRALDELVESGVVVELKDGKSFTYAVQKDYVKWGAFGGNEGRLAALWDRRPASNDPLFKASEELPEEDMTLEGHDPTGSDEMTPQGQIELPGRVTIDRPKSLFGETYEHRKDIERHERQPTQKEKPTTTTPTVVVGAVERDQQTAFAISLACAANAAIAKRWGDEVNTLHFGTGMQVAYEFVTAAVDVDVARAAIAETCRSSKQEKPPSTVAYFRDPIFKAHRAAEQRALNEADAKNQRGGAPRSISLVVSGEDARKREHEEHAEYEAARRKAASAWANDSANTAEFVTISDRIGAQYDGFGKDNAWAKKGRESEIIFACAERAGFPDFETWRAQRRGAA